MVQDLRERRTHYFLRDLEARWQRRRHARFLTISALVGLVVGVLTMISAGVGMAGTIISGMVVAIAVDGLLEGTLGKRRLFPYLDQVEAEYSLAASQRAVS